MSHRPKGARRLPALCLVIVSSLAMACAGQSPARTGAEAAPTPAPAAAATPAEPRAAKAPAITASGAPQPKGFDFPGEPEDGKWLVDPEGRRYFVHEVAKIPGTYLLTDEAHVKFWMTPPFELVRQDEHSFYVKMYGTDGSAVTTPPAPAGPSPELVATYEPKTPEADALSFVRWDEGLPTHGQWRQRFHVVDVNGDGKLDIVHGPARKGGTSPAIFLGEGNGHWHRWSGLELPPLDLDYGDATAADFNGDGVMDLAFASHLKGITVVVGDGTGGFRAWGPSAAIDGEVRKITGAGFNSRALEVVDWNRDGRPDLMALGEGPSLAVTKSDESASYRQGARGPVLFLNQGDGTWHVQGSSGRSFGDALVIGRFNDADRLDVVAASASVGHQGLLYRGRDDGHLEETTIEGLRPASTFRAVSAADFDGDGREDLAVGYSSDELGEWWTGVDVLLARPDGHWERRPLGAEKSQSGVWGLDAGDLDGDGAADLVASTGDAQLWVFRGDGKGSFTRETSPELMVKELVGCTGYHVALADLDGDGAAEVVVSFAGEAQGGMGTALGLTPPSCSSGGALRAWKATRAGGR